MDISFGSSSNDSTNLGISIDALEAGYAVVAVRLTEKNLLEVLEYMTAVIGAVEMNLSKRQMHEFQSEIIHYLVEIYKVRKALSESGEKPDKLH